MKSDSEFLKSLIDVSHVEFQSYDFHRNELIFSSGMAGKLLGYTKEEFFGFSKSFYEALVHPEDRFLIQEVIQRIIASSEGEIIEMTARYRRVDGNYL